MDLKKDYGVSKALETDGVWIALYNDETEILIARLGNKKYQNELERLSAPHTRLLQSKSPRQTVKKNELANKIMSKLFAKTIVLGWKELYEDGKKIEYSYEECLRMLNEYPDFKDDISREAENMDNFFEEELEEIKENLK